MPLAGSDDGGEFALGARSFYESVPLPDEPLAPGFLEAERLLGGCVQSFGVEVLEPEAAFESGIYYFNAAEQPERVNAIRRACEEALAEIGILRTADDATHRSRYRAYLEVHECLAINGYPISEPPSEEQFVEAPSSWHPWEAMIADSAGVLATDDAPTSGPVAQYLLSLDSCPRP